VIIVAHSLGGVIARHYILESKKSERDHQVIAAALYASPLAGAALASIAKRISWRHAHLTQLTVRGDILTSLNSDWVALRLSEDVSVLSVVAGSDAIVSRESALPYIGDQNTKTLIGCGHIDVTKPCDASDLRFRVLKDFLNRFSPQIGPPEPNKTVGKPLYVGDVLFDVYTEQAEPYYVHRREDEIIRSAANSSNIWINGPAGVGKTAALRRLASREKWVFHHQILDGLRGLDARQLMREICNSLYEKAGNDIILPREISDIDLRKAFRKVFDIIAKNTTLAVLVEEIPLDVGEEYMRFVEHCYQLALLCESMNENARIIWLFSSIRDPLGGLPNVSAKLREKIQFINFTVWNEQDLSALVRSINYNLGMQLTPEQTDAVILKADGSPRFVKYFFRRTRNEVASNYTIDELLSSVRRELVV
jgi:hypothetical protein